MNENIAEMIEVAIETSDLANEEDVGIISGLLDCYETIQKYNIREKKKWVKQHDNNTKDDVHTQDKKQAHASLLLLNQNQARRNASHGSEASALGGFWQLLSNSIPVAYMQDGLAQMHDLTGLPWWASIVMSTVLFRSVITLPLTVYQHRIMARIELITLEMPAIVADLKKEAAMAMKKFNWTDKQTRVIYNRSLKKQWNKLIVRDNCHPAKTLIVLWGQIPLWICQSVALRNLVSMLPDPTALEAKIIFTELTIGGFGWIPNLTEVDSSYILPVALGLINISIIEIQSMLRTREPTRLQRYATNAFRVLSVVMVPVACNVPSALCVYWVSSSAYGLAQNLLMLAPTLRRVFGIPLTKMEISHPYNRLWTTIKIRCGKMVKW